MMDDTMKREKDKSDKKNTAASPSFFRKVANIGRNETLRFIVGLMLVIFSVYLLLAFMSFFFTGAADQSILDSGSDKDLMAVDNGVKNYAGSRGAQLSSYLINDCFGLASFFILLFLAVTGLKLMKVRRIRLRRWFICCSLLLVWFSVFFGFAFSGLYADSFIYLGGMHGYNVGRWLESQIGTPGVWLLLLVTAICFFIYLSARTVVWLREVFSLRFLKKKSGGASGAQDRVPEEGKVPGLFTSSWTGPNIPKEEVSEEKTDETDADKEDTDDPWRKPTKACRNPASRWRRTRTRNIRAGNRNPTTRAWT